MGVAARDTVRKGASEHARKWRSRQENTTSKAMFGANIKKGEQIRDRRADLPSSQHWIQFFRGTS